MPDITIRIEKNRESKENNNAPSSIREEAKNFMKFATENVFAKQMISTAKQIISYQASNIGNFSGDYLKEDDVNLRLDIIGDMATVGMGALSKGWIGAVVAVAGITTKNIFKFISMHRQNELLMYEQDYLTKRSGNALINGSRGTEN